MATHNVVDRTTLVSTVIIIVPKSINSFFCCCCCCYALGLVAVCISDTLWEALGRYFQEIVAVLALEEEQSAVGSPWLGELG